MLKYIKRYKLLILLAMILAIFWQGINSLVKRWVVPLVEDVNDNSFLVLVALIACVILVYVVNWDKIKDERRSVFRWKKLTHKKS